MDMQISTTKVNKQLTQGKIIREWDSAKEIGLSAEAEILTRDQKGDSSQSKSMRGIGAQCAECNWRTDLLVPLNQI